MPHRLLALRRIAALSANTLTELIRLKVFYVLLIFALVLIGSSLFMARLTFQQEFQVLKDVALGAISIFTSLLAIVTTARLLPQDVEDRTVYTILAKPVPRFEYILGKLIGVLLLLAISIALMSALFFAILYLREQTVLAEAVRQSAASLPEQRADALRVGQGSTFTANLLPAIAVIYVKASILASLTLFLSTFATTNTFTIVVTTFVYFIGHLQATAREFWLQEQGGGWLSRGFLAVVALVFPDLQLFDYTDEIAAGALIPFSIFAKTVVLGGFYVLIYLLLAIAVFQGKEL